MTAHRLPAQVTVQTAGTFTKRGTYRVAVVLYEGFQPVGAGGGAAVIRASSSKRHVQPVASGMDDAINGALACLVGISVG